MQGLSANIGLSGIPSLAQDHQDVFLVRVDLAIRKGLPHFQILGKVSQEIKEAKDKIPLALLQSGFMFPLASITANIEPSHRQKGSTFLDLALALSILVASSQLPANPWENCIALGQINLRGDVLCHEDLLRFLWASFRYLPEGQTFLLPMSAKDYQLPKAEYLFISHLSELRLDLPRKTVFEEPVFLSKEEPCQWEKVLLTTAQARAFQGLLYAILGNHHSLLVGNPGTGKSMLIKLMKDMQLPWYPEEFPWMQFFLDKDFQPQNAQIPSRPFRSPHHSITEQALVGGGRPVQEGEISKANGGILFLDELTEFKSKVLDAIREPMEERKIEINRLESSRSLPANFLVMAACNPCPCGYFQGRKRCSCSNRQIREYLRKISGPFWDRITLHISLFDHADLRNVSIHRQRIFDALKEASFFRRQRLKKERNVYQKRELYVDETDPLHSFLSLRQKNNFYELARTIADFHLSLEIRVEHKDEAAVYFRNSLLLESLR
ncbi:magnesium chelatase, subunit ChlI [Leptospira ryugenii]|uniref:Magnesium chelatase, subunit ChlI n=1 Tax=Leptospira ryugenii TaxID=1917863 RepID=A0A2P2DWS8_9LEPT|nr:ATP-binding protein [Leptospira ryugenii]GBF49067.1 magnesium chelatase, subunit ChlI [Leptospira ryugenii]